ncbi:hypothetical protein WMY93_009942 [Mugilogobius chulae]|uniref:Uncharacterized protein n=1 Tax=Mugilogobius chulae TaxID=88201 RepID=A0AAW0PC92_9GOBI
METEANSRTGKTVADLELIVKKLSEDLKEKESLLDNFMEVAYKQSQHISTLTTLQDTAVWDPTSLPGPSSSTPHNRPSWDDVTLIHWRLTSLLPSPALLLPVHRAAVNRSAQGLLHLSPQAAKRGGLQAREALLTQREILPQAPAQPVNRASSSQHSAQHSSEHRLTSEGFFLPRHCTDSPCDSRYIR